MKDIEIIAQERRDKREKERMLKPTTAPKIVVSIKKNKSFHIKQTILSNKLTRKNLGINQTISKQLKVSII